MAQPATPPCPMTRARPRAIPASVTSSGRWEWLMGWFEASVKRRTEKPLVTSAVECLPHSSTLSMNFFLCQYLWLYNGSHYNSAPSNTKNGPKSLTPSQQDHWEAEDREEEPWDVKTSEPSGPDCQAGPSWGAWGSRPATTAASGPGRGSQPLTPPTSSGAVLRHPIYFLVPCVRVHSTGFEKNTKQKRSRSNPHFADEYKDLGKLRDFSGIFQRVTGTTVARM